MSVLSTCRGVVACLAMAAPACAPIEDERAAAAPAAAAPVAMQSGASGCEAISRFSRISFIAADRNNDGVVDEAEFTGDVAAAFAGQDRNLDRRLSRSEIPDAPSGSFERINSGRGDSLIFRDLIQAKLAEFQRADANGDGVLSVVEVVQFNNRQGGC